MRIMNVRILRAMVGRNTGEVNDRHGWIVQVRILSCVRARGLRFVQERAQRIVHRRHRRVVQRVSFLG